MQEKLEKYLNLKERVKEMKKQPIGNRIKKNGRLENGIKKVFKQERAEQILTRTEDYSFEEWENISEEYYKLRKELMNAGVVYHDEDGWEVVKRI